MRKASFRVLWTETAIRDLESLVGYITADAPINGAKVLARLKSKAESLKTTPERGRLVPELVQQIRSCSLCFPLSPCALVPSSLYPLASILRLTDSPVRRYTHGNTKRSRTVDQRGAG